MQGVKANDMKIHFTIHAKERCKQRRLSEKWVAARLQRIPISYGSHEHILEGTNVTVVFKDYGIQRIVITLYWNAVEETKPEPKSINLKEVQDVLQKERQKNKQRKKKYKKFKPPKR